MTAKTASPIYSIGEVVNYTDHHDRIQVGEVLRIVASWNGYRDDPLVTYTLRHPTYRGNHFYGGPDKINGGAA